LGEKTYIKRKIVKSKGKESIKVRWDKKKKNENRTVEKKNGPKRTGDLERNHSTWGSSGDTEHTVNIRDKKTQTKGG